MLLLLLLLPIPSGAHSNGKVPPPPPPPSPAVESHWKHSNYHHRRIRVCRALIYDYLVIRTRCLPGLADGAPSHEGEVVVVVVVDCISGEARNLPVATVAVPLRK